jgi:hypothetical protein
METFVPLDIINWAQTAVNGETKTSEITGDTWSRVGREPGKAGIGIMLIKLSGEDND